MNDRWNEVLSVLQQIGPLLAPDAGNCGCHGLAVGLCPDQPAARPGGTADAAPWRRDTVARLIDHTVLRPDAIDRDVERLCDEALANRFQAVCVNPVWVKLCARRLAGGPTLVATVAGFPLGASLPAIKAQEASRAVEDGAREVDMVLNVGALRSQDLAGVLSDVRAVATASHAGGAGLKVIIEAALLSDREKIVACAAAKLAGADFVKTSTGFGPGGATASDVALMRTTVGQGVGVKAAGGIRSWEAARALLVAGASRLGTSASVAILAELPATA